MRAREFFSEPVETPRWQLWLLWANIAMQAASLALGLVK